MSVYVCGPRGRYHQQPDCWYLVPRYRRQPVVTLAAAEARARGYWECPYCCRPPDCCRTGNHAGRGVPRLPAADTPDWELSPEQAAT